MKGFFVVLMVLAVLFLGSSAALAEGLSIHAGFGPNVGGLDAANDPQWFLGANWEIGPWIIGGDYYIASGGSAEPALKAPSFSTDFSTFYLYGGYQVLDLDVIKVYALCGYADHSYILGGQFEENPGGGRLRKQEMSVYTRGLAAGIKAEFAFGNFDLSLTGLTTVGGTWGFDSPDAVPPAGARVLEGGPGSLTCINAAFTYHLNEVFGIFASFDYAVAVNEGKRANGYDDSACYLTAGVELSF